MEWVDRPSGHAPARPVDINLAPKMANGNLRSRLHPRTTPTTTRKVVRKRAAEFSPDERSRQLADIEANNGEDAAEISASDAFKEFPPSP